MHSIFGDPNKKVILSVDGGGMRGLISVAMLAHLEEKTGLKAYELFDMVAGTSIGAFVAAGLALKMSANEMIDVIFTKGLPAAFGSTGFWSWVRFLMTGLRYRYDLEPFFASFGDLIRGKRVKDVEHIIVLMTTKDVRTGNTYFVVNRGPGAAAFEEWPLSGAVGASAVAPIYFPPVLGNFVDGGVGINGNPCLAAAIEALEYIGADEGFEENKVILVSLGTGYPPQDRAEGAAGRFWLLPWVGYILNELLNDGSLQQTFSTRAIYGNKLDFRRYDPYLTRESVKDVLGVDPGMLDPAKLSLDTTGDEQRRLMEQIGRAYAAKLDWAKPGVMPWDTEGGHPLPKINAQADWTKWPLT